MGKRRVVITGMGTVNPLGASVEETWETIMRKESGITGITRFDASHLPTQIAGEIKDFDYRPFFDESMRKQAKRMDVFCHYATAAAKEATDRAGVGDLPQKHRIGVAVGSGIGGLNVQHDNSVALAQKGPRRVSPFYIPMSIGNMAGGILSMIYGATGPNISNQTACATANHAMATATMIIQNDMADVMIAGGAEGSLNELAIAAFGNMRAISTRNDSPQTASRPFDKERDGFVLSEGAGVLVLEEYEHAKRRGADIVCEVLSCGMSGDAYDFVAPDPEGRGAFLSMNMALTQAGVRASELDYINTHGTSTPVGDVAELKGVKRLLYGDNVGGEGCYVGSTKSYHGHLLGAAAGLEAIITASAMVHDTVPANINLFNRDPEIPEEIELPTEHVQTGIVTVLSNSFGFGGHNSSLLLRKV